MFRKRRGGTTGRKATSSDNRIALVGLIQDAHFDLAPGADSSRFSRDLGIINMISDDHVIGHTV